LLGILKGITADQDINEAEVIFLSKWLIANEDIAEVWPVPNITAKIIEILEDGIITKDECSELYQLVNQVTGNDFNETGDASDNPTQLFDTVETITHTDYGFCFTGKFRSGSRSEIESKALNLGAIVIKKTPTLSTHYVVVGSLSSRDWAYSSHGRKIEHAKSMQAKGHKIFIISEDQWMAAI
jgi:NAD-dependent DNA ligase